MFRGLLRCLATFDGRDGAFLSCCWWATKAHGLPQQPDQAISQLRSRFYTASCDKKYRCDITAILRYSRNFAAMSNVARKSVYTCNCSFKSEGWSREEHYNTTTCNLSRSKRSVGVCSRCRSESTDHGLEDERTIENYFESHRWNQGIEPNGGTRRVK